MSFFDVIYIDTLKARKLFQLTESIRNIPTGELISHWHERSNGQKYVVMDGVDYFIEVSSPQNYLFKEYNNPTSQEVAVPEADQINMFIKSVNRLLDKEKCYEAFFKELPPDTYHNNTAMYITKLQSNPRKNKHNFKKNGTTFQLIH